MLRDESNPFEFPEENFKKLFRLDRQSAMELCNVVNNLLPQGTRNTHIHNHLQVLLTLNFYAYGSYQTGIGKNFSFAVSQSTVSRIINNVTDIICNHLLHLKVKFPENDEEIATTKQR